MTQALPVYVVNLDRRPDRHAFMAGQLDGMGVAWERIVALDAATAEDAEIGREVALEGHVIAMGRGALCGTISHFDAMRALVRSEAPAGVVLEDDTQVSPDLAGFVSDAGWIPRSIGLVQGEKWSTRQTSKLLGPPLGPPPVPGRSIRRLYSRTGGAGCYVITRAAARRLLSEKGVVRMPIDHLLFNLNLSVLARALGVAMVVPALGRQDWARFPSDISAGREAQTKSIVTHIRRGLSEVRLVPAQFAAMLFRGARVRPVEFAERTA
jgi:glycosyl transferase, family 25